MRLIFSGEGGIAKVAEASRLRPGGAGLRATTACLKSTPMGRRRDASATSRSAFSLLEVLIAIALFGLATAGLLSAIAPVHEALFRLSSSTRDSGDLEIVKAIAETSKDRSTLMQGGSTTLPDGRAAGWRAELEPTDTEALFLVRLTVDITGSDAVRSDYLRFDPRWLDPTDEKPRWLQHTGTASQGGRGGQGGGRVGRGGQGRPGQGAQPGQGGRGGRGGAPGGARPQGGRGGARPAPPAGGGGR